MFYDIDGNVLYDWRVTGLVEGHDSDVFVLGVDAPQDADLELQPDERLTILARRHGTPDAFVDISTTKISLRALSGRILFDVKLRASEDLEGFDRVALTPGTTVEKAAAWRA